MPVSEAGLKPDDQFLTIGGEEVDSSDQVRKYIREHPDQPINIAVKRGGERLEFTAQTKNVDGQNLLGVVPSERPPMKQVGIGDALSYSVSSNLEILRLTGMALGQVFSGQRSVRDTFSGPIGIAQASKRAAEQAGLEGVFQMLGFLSLNLGIFNLLPIPMLDGGMIFMLLVEGVLAWLGLKLSIRMRERIQQVGFVFLLLLMGFVIINDVTKFAPGWFGSKEKPAATQTK